MKKSTPASGMTHHKVMHLLNAYRTGGPGPKATLLALGVYLGLDERDGIEEWSGHPSQERLAYETEQSVRTVRRHLQQFTEDGILRIHATHTGAGRGKKLNRYVLQVDYLEDILSRRSPEADSDLEDTEDRPRGHTEHDLEDIAGDQEVAIEEPITMASASPPLNGKQPRKRDPDPLWDSLLAACGVEGEITSKARGAYNRAVKELREVGATPEEVRRRAENYEKKWPTATLTPTALARHWAECGKAPPSVRYI